MVSMRTLCRERPGVFALSYSDLARVIEKHSAAPPADSPCCFDTWHSTRRSETSTII
jgi:hypothetical protein